MLDLSILTPSSEFPDLSVQAAIADLDGRETDNTVGVSGVVQEIKFRTSTSGSSIRYLLEPELEIPCILLEGPGHRRLAERLETLIDCIDGLKAAISYTSEADDTVKVTLLRILSAHALQRMTDQIASAALTAAQDPSPFVRLGVVQLAQYANDPQTTRILEEVVMPDADPDVQEFAEAVLSRLV